jgi:hypothetical protein
MRARFIIAIIATLGVTACESDAEKPDADDTKSAVDTAKTVASQAAKDIKAAEGKPPCEEGYAQIKALIEAFKGVPGNQASPKVPTENEFMEACTSLPADIQKCFLINELMKTPAKLKSCKAKIEALPPDVKARATALMESAVAKGK